MFSDLCSNTCPGSGAVEPSRGEETRFVHPHQPFMTSERLSRETQSLHNSEGEEVGTAQVFPTMKSRGNFRNQECWREGAWCSPSGFMRNTRRLPQLRHLGLHCPCGGGSGTVVASVVRLSPKSVQALYASPCRPPTWPPPQASGKVFVLGEFSGQGLGPAQ